MKNWNPINRRLLLWSVLFLVAIGLAQVGMQSLFGARERARRESCQNSLRVLFQGLQMYQRDYEGSFPLPVQPRRNASEGWATIVSQLQSCEGCLVCPENPFRAQQASSALLPSYWINARILGRNQKEIAQPGRTVLLGDGDDGTQRITSGYSISQFPSRWINDTSSPMFRHNQGANYLFADGSIFWLKPHEVENHGGKKTPFALK